MKKILFTLVLSVLCLGYNAKAQRSMPINYALIDSQYILSEIPQYKSAMEQMKAKADNWNAEIKQMQDDAKSLYMKYKAENKQMNADEKKALEQQIVDKEEAAKTLQEKYFGPDGEMMKLQQEKIKPIRDAIYEAVKLISSRRGYSLVLDRATGNNIIFASPEADISNDVLHVLGINK